MRAAARRLAPLLAAAVLAACGGRSAVTPPAPAHAADAQRQAVTFTVAIPPRVAAGARRPRYVSPSTAYITAGVTHGGASAGTAANACQPASCSITIAAPVGVDFFQLSLYDGPNGKLLSSGSTTQDIVPGQFNTVKVVFDGQVAKVILTPAAIAFSRGFAATTTLGLQARDADDNVIVVPPGGLLNPITVGIGDSSGSLKLGGGGSGITLSYDGSSAVPASIVVFAQAYGAVQATTTITFGNVPMLAQYGTPQPGAGLGGNDITAGPDGAIWVTPHAKALTRVTAATDPTGPGNVSYSPLHAVRAGTTYAEATGIAPGPDATVWFTEAGQSLVGRVEPSDRSTFGTFPLPSASANPASIVTGADNNLWFVEQSAIGRTTTTGALSEFPLPAGASGLTNIVSAPDGNLYVAYVTAPDAGAVLRITTAGAIGSVGTIPGTPQRLAVGPDGALWAAMTSAGAAGEIARLPLAGGAATAYHLNGGGGGYGIVSGPRARLYVLTPNGMRIVDAAGNDVQDLAVPTAAVPIPMVVGPDQRIWWLPNDGTITALTAP